MNVVKINQECRQLEADGKIDQKRSEEKERTDVIVCSRQEYKLLLSINENEVGMIHSLW